MYILDRYLSVETASRRELQLVGISAMIIAFKYEETWAPKVKRISEVAQGSKILATHTDSPGEFRLCSLRLMKLPKMLNWAWSIMSELQSSLPRSRQVNTTNRIKQKLPAVLPSPVSTSQMHNGSNHAKVCTQQEKLNSSL
ncbi:Cyclin-B1-3 [Capsicum chinense]|nr:Cyclin-B1-3 [Capsicum chinense]